MGGEEACGTARGVDGEERRRSSRCLHAECKRGQQVEAHPAGAVGGSPGDELLDNDAVDAWLLPEHEANSGLLCDQITVSRQWMEAGTTTGSLKLGHAAFDNRVGGEGRGDKER